jgi:ethanolamine utilization protein EutQ (cupin superfamily)
MVEMLNVSEKAAKILMAKPGSFFVVPKNSEVPFETCAKFGVKLFVTPMRDEPFKIVKRI